MSPAPRGWLSRRWDLFFFFFLLSSSGFRSSWLIIGTFNALTASVCALWIRHAEGGVASLGALVALGAALAVIPAAGAWMGWRWRGQRLLLAAPCWMLMDRAAALSPIDYLWTGLGTPLADWPVAAQAASLAGPETLSLLAAGCGAALALLARGAPRAALAQGPAWLALALAFGWWRLPESRALLLGELNRLIERAAALRPSLIVLPEAALPGLVRFDEELAGFARAAVERSGRPLLFGSIDRDESGNLYNAAFLISPDGTVSVYRKTQLAPWVEDRFARGGPTLFPYQAAFTLAPALWAEDASADWLREAGTAGADLAVAMINTEALVGPAETLIHRRKAQLAAIAAGMPLLRAGNHAGTSAVGAFGRVSHEAAGGRLVVAARVAPGRAGTWFGAYGTWTASGVAGAWMAGFGLCPQLGWLTTTARPRRRRRTRQRAGAPAV